MLEALQWRASLNNPADREALLAHPDAIVIPDEQVAAGRVFVAVLDRSIAGFAALETRDDGDVELDGLFVEPSFQRRGIGRTLVDFCAAWARARGSAALHVTGNPHACAFYEANGFEHAGRVATRFGEGLLMKRPL